MSSKQDAAERIAPLLLELARAARARRFYPASHPTVQGALKRSAVAWRDALERHGALHVELRPDGFALDDGTQIEALGCEELADMLRTRGVTGFTGSAGLDLRELATFIDLLNGDSPTPLGELLREHDVTRLEVRERPLEPRPPVDARGHEFSDATLELLRLIAELERSEEAGAYRMVARRMRDALGRLLEDKNHVDAYRAALVYCRHASEGPGLPGDVREEARTQLRELVSSEEMVGFVIEKAGASASLTSVQAVRVLSSAGPAAVAALLEEHGRRDPEQRRQLVSILIAMGDEAFPTIIEELACDDSRRVQRAAMLLGDMQNPRGVEYLAQLLDGDDPNVRREAARALLRIGTERAIFTLVDALGQDEPTALVAASCLGSTRNRSALRALIQAVPDEAGRPPAVRIEAIRGLGRIRHESAVPALSAVLQSGSLFRRGEERELRVAAAHALGRIGGDEASAALRAAAGRGDAAVCEACAQALQPLEG
jgi:HEAT repeat protein